ncbi:plasmid mobilization protein [Aurantimonas manganoxydans]|uniref:plasmid mobilization protein n=1 Tax=Aurantimonas manganoxydans TaxID=651183 RepID=UPI0003257A9E|nr:hypothetical protein [Aurantimonas manganoxydans]
MSKSESRKATVVRAVRLTPDQAAAVDAAATARGVGPSAFAKDVILRAAKLPIPARARRRDLQAEALGPLLTALARVGANMNQIAAKMHSTGATDTKALATASHHLAAIHEAVLKLGER